MRKQKAREEYAKIKKYQQEIMKEAPVTLIPKRDEQIYGGQGHHNLDDLYRPDYKPAEALVFGDMKGLGNAHNFEDYEGKNKKRKRELLDQTKMQTTNQSMNATIPDATLPGDTEGDTTGFGDPTTDDMDVTR